MYTEFDIGTAIGLAKQGKKVTKVGTTDSTYAIWDEHNGLVWNNGATVVLSEGNVNDMWRIVELKNCRPWEFSEIPVGGILKSKMLPAPVVTMIISCSRKEVFLGHLNKGISRGDLLLEYTLLDGTPCGVELETFQQ